MIAVDSYIASDSAMKLVTVFILTMNLDFKSRKGGQRALDA